MIEGGYRLDPYSSCNSVASIWCLTSFFSRSNILIYHWMEEKHSLHCLLGTLIEQLPPLIGHVVNVNFFQAPSVVHMESLFLSLSIVMVTSQQKSTEDRWHTLHSTVRNIRSWHGSSRAWSELSVSDDGKKRPLLEFVLFLTLWKPNPPCRGAVKLLIQ